MPEWTRKPGDLVKSATITEGEIVSLLLSSEGIRDSDILDAAYESVTHIGESRGKAFSFLATATVIAILAKFNVISSFSTGGISVAEAAFKPFALTAFSATGLYFSYFQSRYRYFELWFESAFMKSTPGHRAELLLRYPIAFDVFKFEPSFRGYPTFVHPKDSGLWRLPSFVLLFIAIIVYGALSLALWVSLAIDVWAGAFPNWLVAIFVIISSALLVILQFCLPFAVRKTRKYQHFGLVALLTQLQESDPERHRHFLQRVSKIAEDAKVASVGE